MNKFTGWIVFSLFLLFATSAAQTIDIFGYYEPQYMGVILDNEYSQLFSNKLRVDLQSNQIDNVTIGANFDYISYQGRTEWNLLDYFPDRIKNQVSPEFEDDFGYAYKDTVFLDNAFVKIAISKLDITLGKQQVSIGTGYAWNPTDLFNSKDIIDPTYEQPGRNAARFDIALSNRYTGTVMYLPKNSWQNSGKLIKFNGKISHFDYSILYIEKMWTYSDFTSPSTPELKRRLYGGDLVGEIFGLGIWGEFAYNTLETQAGFWETLIGADYTLDNGMYFLAEYLHNELAKSDYHDYDLNDWMRYFLGENRTISRDNLYLYFDYPLTDLIHLNNSIALSLTDQSLNLMPSLRYNIFQNIEINIFAGFNIGENNKAFSKDQGSTAIFRMKAYF